MSFIFCRANRFHGTEKEKKGREKFFIISRSAGIDDAQSANAVILWERKFLLRNLAIFQMKIFSKLLQEPWLLLFGLFQLILTALGALHVRRSFSPFFSSPKLLLLLVLLALYALFATASAIFERVRHCSVRQQQKQRLPQTHRLRPLLFVTSTVSVFGVPTLFVLPYFCRHFSPLTLPLDFDGICSAFGAFESASLFSIVLSLLITASIPLRALLHRQLAELRQDALWARLIGRNCWICVEIA
uniref:Uncharacterized protein n=1 Tax=Globodera rostochiensis TaxID=31243 RepID=A0A914H0B7_GLORO